MVKKWSRKGRAARAARAAPVVPRGRGSLMPPAPDYHDAEGLKTALDSLAYDIPEGCKRVPWVDRLDYVLDREIPVTFDGQRNIERENMIHDMTLEGVNKALARLQYLGIEFSRPRDFYAEMLKSDEHMAKVARMVQREK